jgi:CDP-diacylglycerol--serine O-phosphatidyltransferase
MWTTIFRQMRAPDWLSLLNALSGFLAITLIMTGNLFGAAIAMMVAAFLDWCDGKVAKRYGQRDWGKNIDSLADAVSFGAAPAVMVWYFIYVGAVADIGMGLTLIIPAMMIAAGLMRLTRYNTLDSTGFYMGMPITLNGVIFPLLYFALNFLGTPDNMVANIFALAGLVSTILMIGDFRIRKR